MHGQYRRVYIETLQDIVMLYMLPYRTHRIILRDIQEIRTLKYFNILWRFWESISASKFTSKYLRILLSLQMSLSYIYVATCMRQSICFKKWNLSAFMFFQFLFIFFLCFDTFKKASVTATKFFFFFFFWNFSLKAVVFNVLYYKD